MSKIKKFTKSPSLFFRDYFLKKKPIVYGNGVELLESEKSNIKIQTNLKAKPIAKLIAKPIAKGVAKPAVKLTPVAKTIAPPGLPPMLGEDIYPITFPIDIVYTWVDSDDEAFMQSKRECEDALHVESSRNHPKKAEAFDNARFQSRDELKYSIRSLHAYAPWINQIYIVTNGQVPKWLNLDNPKVKIIAHSEIIDAEYLPTFNSHVIESYLYKIPGLAENFIYLNDDVLLARATTPNYFFWSSGRAKLFITNSELPNGPKGAYDTPTQWAAKNARALIYDETGIYVSKMFAHTFHPQTKTVHAKLDNIFSDSYHKCRVNKFRAREDLPPATFLHHHYSHITGYATLHRTTCMYFNIRATFATQCYKSLLARKGTELAPYSMCLNDHVSEGGSFMKDYEEKLGTFLESYFSTPSPYELIEEPKSLIESAAINGNDAIELNIEDSKMLAINKPDIVSNTTDPVYENFSEIKSEALSATIDMDTTENTRTDSTRIFDVRN